jgi:putative acetyltransferase
VDALRDGGYARLSLVAEVEDALVGHVLFSTLTLGRDHDALALAPVAVVPEYQRRGIGTGLITEGLRAVAAQGYEIVLVLGDPAYYARFGFSSEPAGGLEHPYPTEAFMALQLVPGTLRGVVGKVTYPPPFEAA